MAVTDMRKKRARLSMNMDQQKPSGDVLAPPNESDPAGQMDNDPQAVAEQHGPAQHVEIDHNEEAGEHTVRSEHPDGHHHESRHGSRKEAHEAAHDLAGADEGESEPEPEENESYQEPEQ